ncbi:MAG: tRNA pseudouridine(38-40) synthase TruA, partial [Coriobacteriia bacterium]|nr:tRNA pseudouridine(38-40) synthase TruA [Coriobacteriia bacterium]
MMHTYMLSFSYEGADFNGFARQKEAHVVTVQETLEQALATVLRLEALPQTVCAGRTDAGVHALMQVLSFDLPGPALDVAQCSQIVRSLNAITPPSISVKGLRSVQAGFSARFDARSREYRYYIFNESRSPVFTKDFTWHVPKKLDLDALQCAANHLVGEHDFRSFCTSHSAPPEKNTVREIKTIEIFEQNTFGEDLIVIRIVGTAFLHSMVRIIVGTLQEV